MWLIGYSKLKQPWRVSVILLLHIRFRLLLLFGVKNNGATIICFVFIAEFKMVMHVARLCLGMSKFFQHYSNFFFTAKTFTTFIIISNMDWSIHTFKLPLCQCKYKFNFSINYSVSDYSSKSVFSIIVCIHNCQHRKYTIVVSWFSRNEWMFHHDHTYTSYTFSRYATA